MGVHHTEYGMQVNRTRHIKTYTISGMVKKDNAIKDLFWERTSEGMMRLYGKENLTQLGKDSKIGGSGVTRIKNRTNVRLETLSKVAKVFGREPWQMLLPHVVPESEFVLTIPRLANAAGMGKGVALLETDSVIDRITVTKPWLQAHVPSSTKPADLRVITAFGDSMEPTLKDGDFVLVDTAVHTFIRDGLYVLVDPSEGLYIKRVSRVNRDGRITLLVTSDNSTTPAFGTPEGLEMVGQVVWAWNGRKF